MLVGLLWLGSQAWALPGQVEPDVACAADPAVRYALFLPSTWSAETTWPLLVVLDARGRAVPSLQPFVPAADRYGWVVASAYGSASDTVGPDPTPGALAAILTDVQARAAIDDDAVVLAGFSGTARSAWAIGEVASDVVLGVIGVGGSTLTGAPPRSVPPFLWYGIAGTTDFNHGEVMQTAGAILERGGQAVFERFEGGHGWPGEGPADRALGWMTLRGEQRGRIAVLPGRADAVVAAARARIDALGPGFEAWQLARGHAPELSDVAATLGARRDVRKQARIERRLAAGEFQSLVQIAAVGTWLLDPQRRPPSLGEARAAFGAAALQRRAAGEPDTPRGQSAARMLALAQARFGFYVPRDLRRRGDHAREAVALQLATTLPGHHAGTWYNLACALALAGDAEAALAGLEHAAALGYADAEWPSKDPDLASLRDHPGFRAWLAAMRG